MSRVAGMLAAIGPWFAGLVVVLCVLLVGMGAYIAREDYNVVHQHSTEIAQIEHVEQQIKTISQDNHGEDGTLKAYAKVLARLTESEIGALTAVCKATLGCHFTLPAAP